MNITISEVEEIFKNIFGEDEKGLVNSTDSVYELSSDKDFYKLVISLHGLSKEDISIIHTKFIFKIDLNKSKLIEDSFIYLYDINCVYHKIEFSNIVDLENKIDKIIESNNFGEDLQILSDFIEAPAMFLNYYMMKNDITEYSVFDVKYEPKFKILPCYKTTFDFKININNNYNIELSIHKVEPNDKDEPNIYKFQFKFMNEIETHETDSLKNVHYFIGDNISKILDKKLKNK
jgi:hypothetical protein